MTTGEFYYLALCFSVLSLFGAALAYNSWSWSNWRRSRSVTSSVPKNAHSSKPEIKLAA